jgi:predicted nucleic acid-binding protein
MPRKASDEVFRLKIDGNKPAGVTLRQLSRLLEATARLMEEVAAEAELPLPPLFLRNVAAGSVDVVIRSAEAPRAKPLTRAVSRVVKSRAKDSGPGVVRALDELREATIDIGEATLIAKGGRPIPILTPDPAKVAIGAEDQIHARVVGLLVTRRGTEVRLRPLDGGTTETFVASSQDVAVSALRLFDHEVVAQVLYRSAGGELRPATLERLLAFKERNLLDVADEIRDAMVAEGADIDARNVAPEPRRMKLVAVDTSTIVWLLAPKGDATIRKHNRMHVENVISGGGTLLIPSVVIAELHRDNAVGSRHLEQFGAIAAGSLRVAPFTLAASDVAGRMRTQALERHRRPTGIPCPHCGKDTLIKDSRGAITYDALIAATSVVRKVTSILTANPRDYRALLESVGAKIGIVDTREPPKGQHDLFPTPAPKKARAKPKPTTP